MQTEASSGGFRDVAPASSLQLPLNESAKVELHPLVVTVKEFSSVAHDSLHRPFTDFLRFARRAVLELSWSEGEAIGDRNRMTCPLMTKGKLQGEQSQHHFPVYGMQ